MNMNIRIATEADVPRLVDLSEQKRIQYQTYQPLFWRKAQDSKEKQLLFLADQIANENIIALVYEQESKIHGFVLANVRNRKECDIDDFCVMEASLWDTVGRALLEDAGKRAKERNVPKYNIACGHLDQPKRTMLRNFGLSIDSYWYTGAIATSDDQQSVRTVREANLNDVSQMASLSEMRRTEFPEIGRDNMLVLVHDVSGALHGYAIALVIPTPPVYDPGGSTCLVLDLVAGSSEDIESVGTSLLKGLGQKAKERGAVQCVVICDYSDQSKQIMLQNFGLTIATEWYTGPI